MEGIKKWEESNRNPGNKKFFKSKKNAVEDTLADGNKWNEEFQGSNTKYIVKKKQNNT
jgi:hypothetical protein